MTTNYINHSNSHIGAVYFDKSSKIYSSITSISSHLLKVHSMLITIHLGFDYKHKMVEYEAQSLALKIILSLEVNKIEVFGYLC